MGRLNRWRNSVRWRIYWLAVVPPALLALTLTAVLTWSRVDDLASELHKDGALILRGLGVSTEYGLLAGNRQALEQILAPAREVPLVRNAAVIDSRGRLLAGGLRLSPDLLLAADAADDEVQQLNLDGRILLARAVHQSAVEVDDLFAGRGSPPRVLGWVVLEMEPDILLAQQREAILLGGAVGLVGLLLAVWLGGRIARGILGPVSRIQDTVEALRADQLDARIEPIDGGELGRLQEGINLLAEQVARNRAELEREVNEATQDLQQAFVRLEAQNRKLERARLDAEEASRIKDEFLARMSHELRTPLTSVLGFIELLHKTALDSQQRQYADIVRRTSRLLLSLIDDILDFSRLQSDAIRLEAIEFNLDEQLQQLLEMHLPAAREKGLELIYIPDPSLPERLRGDPTRISQIVGNLVSNAVKFTEQGEVAISLASRCRKGVAELEIRVSDSGIGISREQLDQLFRPFVQADPSISRRYGGSGLGLVICRRLVELMGGDLDIRSEPGKGTEVTVRLKLEALSPAPPAQLFTGLAVLLYDRSPLSRRALRRRLAYWGCAVASVKNRRQLQQQLRLHGTRFQVLLISLTERELRALADNRLFGDLLGDGGALFHGRRILLTGREPGELREEYGEVLVHLRPDQILRTPASGHELVAALRGEGTAEGEAEVASRTRQDLEGLHVLVAEDNPFNQLLIRQMLELHGAEVMLAGNGEEALALIEREAVDVVVMDLHMPVMNGIEACRAIRALPGPESRIPVITLTASTSAAEHEPLKGLDISANLHKPIDEPALVRALIAAAGLDGADELAGLPAGTDLQRLGISAEELRAELKRLLEALRACAAREDQQGLRDQLHQLRGLAALTGNGELESHALAVRTAILAEDRAEQRAALARLEVLLEAQIGD